MTDGCGVAATRWAGMPRSWWRSPTRFMLDLSPGARRALISLDGCPPEERQFVTRLLGRAALKAREKVVASRVYAEYSPMTNSPLDTEEAIGAEAVMATRR